MTTLFESIINASPLNHAFPYFRLPAPHRLCSDNCV